MLDYTKMAIKQTIADLKRTDYVRNIITQLVYIFYLVYTLIVRTGYFAFNIALLALSVAYLIFFLVMTSCGKSPEGKQVKRVTTGIFVWCKRLIKLFTLGLTIYGICTAVEHVSAVSVILAALMIVGWLLQIVFEVLIKILTNRVTLITDALEADIDNIIKPFKTVGNFFKKVTGHEVPPPKEPTKNQLKLKEKIEAFRNQQKEKKLEAKRLAEEAKEEEKRLAIEEKEEQKRLAEEEKARRKEERLALKAGTDETAIAEEPPMTEKQRKKQEKLALKAAKKADRKRF